LLLPANILSFSDEKMCKKITKVMLRKNWRQKEKIYTMKFGEIRKNVYILPHITSRITISFIEFFSKYMFGHMVVMNSIVERNYRSIGKPRCSLSGLPTSTALTREDMIGVYRDTSKDCQGDKGNFCRIILAGGTSHNDNSPCIRLFYFFLIVNSTFCIPRL
jgi:hypothetical protein